MMTIRFVDIVYIQIGLRKINESKKTIIITGNAHMRYEYYKRWGERERETETERILLSN